jgi:hypothetical protein
MMPSVNSSASSTANARSDIGPVTFGAVTVSTGSASSKTGLYIVLGLVAAFVAWLLLKRRGK